MCVRSTSVAVRRIFTFILQVALSVWRDEARGKNVEDDQAIELSDDDAQQQTHNSHPSGSAQTEHASSSPSGPTRPPSSATEVEEDDFDIDAVIRAEVERSGRERLAARQEQDRMGKDKEKVAAPSAYGDDDAIWNGMNPILNTPTSAGSGMITEAIGNDDLAIWDAVDALEGKYPASNKPLVSQRVDDDEDMWDVVKEIETMPTTTTVQATTTTTESTLAAAHPPPPQNDDDDWEDMYV